MDVMKKEDLIAALEETYKMDEFMVNDTLEKMAAKSEQIEAMREIIFQTQQRMKKTLKKIRELKKDEISWQEWKWN